MSVTPEDDALQRKRQQINRLVQEIEQFSESPIGITEYFSEYLQRVLTAIAAPAGVVWLRTPQGHLQLQHQINFAEIGLDRIENGQASHGELLRQTVQQARPRLIPPRSGPGGDGNAAGANLSSYCVLIAPIVIDKQVAGLLEVWQEPDRPPEAMRGFLRFLSDMTDYASRYLRNTQLRQMYGQQQVWTQLEAYSRQIHGSLNPREVCYHVANEGRRLVQCDRVSVAIRQGSSTRVEAISGADVIEKRSALVQHMRDLFDQVIVWGERLVYSGKKDESLPPKVLAALDKYLEESASKLLIIAPMKDDREAEKKRPARSAMMVESFEPNVTPEQMSARMDIILKHAGSAVYNAVEMRRLPFRWFLQPLANLKDYLRGNRLAIAGAILGGVFLLSLAMAVIPWPLRMEAKGNLLPKKRENVYCRFEGQVVDVPVVNGQRVSKDEVLLKIKNLELVKLIEEQMAERHNALTQMKLFQEELTKTNDQTRQTEYRMQLSTWQQKLDTAEARLKVLREESPNPRASPVRSPMNGVVATFDAKERLSHRLVKPDIPLMQVVDRDGEWELELRIPEGRIGHIRKALAESPDGRLAVDILISSFPDAKSFRGWLTADGLGGMVEMHENEPMLLARVQLDDITREMLDRMPVGADVTAKVRCGNRAIGYVWFHELWEFFYEKVLF